ncbi:MAG: hypothetical protein IJE07_14910 [Clostridia bacterium]|nr:hypothetical protein [Clostridia bacterium]
MDQYNNPSEEQQGSILSGLIGALLGGIIGAIVAGIFYLILNETNTLLGFGIGFLVGGGYKLFKGRKGVSVLVVGIVCSLLAVVLAEAVFYVGLIEKDYAEVVKTYDEAGISKSSAIYPTRADCYDFYLNDEEVITSFKKDLGTDVLFVGVPAIISIVGFYIDSKRKGEVPVQDDSTGNSGEPPVSGIDNMA